MSCIEYTLIRILWLGILCILRFQPHGREIYTFCIVLGFNGCVADDLAFRCALLCLLRFLVFASAPTARKWFWKYSSISESFLPWVSGSNNHTKTTAANETPAKNHCTAWDPVMIKKCIKIDEGNNKFDKILYTHTTQKILQTSVTLQGRKHE